MSAPPFDPTTRRRFLSLGAGLAAGTTLASCRASDPAREADEAERAEERFADLTDRSGEIAPISAEEREARRVRCSALLAERGLDALVVEPGATMTYLAGVEWGLSERLFALVLLAGGEAFWVVPGFEVERARGRIEAAGAPAEIVPWEEHEYPFRPLAAELAARRAERVAAEPSLRARFLFGVAEALGRPTLESGHEVVVELRGRKDAHELALLRLANELTQQALAAVHERLEPGMRSSEIARLVRAAQRRLGLEGVWELTLVGPDAALPHGGTGDVGIGRGDVLLVDTGGSLHGYQSDNTRTWVPFGDPSREFERVWHVVHDAQAAAFAALRPGAECRSIDAVARAVIGGAGFGEGYEAFTHRLGHGIGLEGHEDPYLDGGSRVVLAPGMTFSDEPGIYLPGRFGCRIEDIVAVTEDGAEHFGSWQQGPRSPA